MSLFPVSARKKNELEERMRRLGIRPEDIAESFVRSSGPGGQKVNKSSTCVVLLHRPTGIQVKCQTERSQVLNRFLARRMLLDKIERQKLGALSAEQQRIEKIRRQKRRRSRRAKTKMLADKRLQAQKKAFRSPVKPHPREE
jgi:protein subunit release factor B